MGSADRMKGSGSSLRKQLDGFPFAQILILSVVRFAEPISFTSLFPYIFFMVKSFKQDHDESEIARYSGYISGAFAISQVCSGIFWGSMSDKYGRRPIMIIGLLGSATGLILFGLSTNLYTAMISRSIAGLLNGNVGVIRTSIGEIAKERRHQALAFSTMPLIWQVGCVIGPMLGGYLASPVENHPGWFHDGHNKLFEAFPYLLPNIIVGSLLLFGAVVAFLFLEESNESVAARKNHGDIGLRAGAWIVSHITSKHSYVRNHRDLESIDAQGSFKSKHPHLEDTFTSDLETHPLLVESEDEQEREETNVSWSSILTKPIKLLLLSNFLMSLHTIVIEEFFPVLLSTSIEKENPSKFPFRLVGGLGFDAPSVGFLMSMNGIVGIFIMLVVFPVVDNLFGSLKSYQGSITVFPVLYFVLPYIVFFAGYPTWVIKTAAISIMMIKTLVMSIGFPELLLLINRAVKSKRHSGAVNGVAQVCSALARALGPIIWGYIMSYGQQIGRAQLAWWSLTILSGIAMIQSRQIKEMADDEEEDEEDKFVEEIDAVQRMQEVEQ